MGLSGVNVNALSFWYASILLKDIPSVKENSLFLPPAKLYVNSAGIVFKKAKISSPENICFVFFSTKVGTNFNQLGRLGSNLTSWTCVLEWTDSNSVLIRLIKLAQFASFSKM